MNNLLENEVVEEAVLLAETIAAVEASRDPRLAEEVSFGVCHEYALFSVMLSCAVCLRGQAESCIHIFQYGRFLAS